MAITLKKIIPGDGSQDASDKIYDNDNALNQNKADKTNAEGDEVVYAPGGSIDLTEVNDKIDELESSIYIEEDTGYTPVTTTWVNGYYVDLDGGVKGGGTNALYKLSDPISVNSTEDYKALLQAGNLLAVSGWTNGVYNSSLAVKGVDTNNPATYSFTIPSGVNQIRLTCRVELTTPTLSKKGGGGETVKVNRIDELEKEVNSLIGKSSDIARFSNFLGSANITGNGTLLGGGTLYFPTNIATEDLDFITKITVNSQNTEFGVCRADTSNGTAIVVKSNTVEVRRINSSVGAIIYSYDLPFTITPGNSYIVRLYKQNKDVFLSVCSELNIFNQFSERLDSKDLGRNWGRPSVFCLNGQITVNNAILRKSDYTTPLMFCVGDSLIEGWGVVNNLDKRYIALIQDLAHGNVDISGRGGETTTSLLTRFDVELAKTSSTYVILAIGTNDSNISTYTSNMGTLISKVKASGKIPILVTITPRSGYPITDMNTFVRNSGEIYIDMNKAVNNGNENTWNPLYVNSDNVHPNVLGNEVMFKRAIYDLYYFYTTKDLIELREN